MRMRDVSGMLVGGAVIYMALAACTASEHAGSHPGNTDPGSPGGPSGGITDPVPSAKADPASGSRLKAVYRTGEDGSKEYLPGVWYDMERQENCSFTTAADGKERCLPSAPGSMTLYADAACKQPLVIGNAECAPKYAMTFETGTCSSSVVHIRSIGASASPAQLYLDAGGTCVSAGPPDPKAMYYQIGAEIAATSFVASSVQHEK